MDRRAPPADADKDEAEHARDEEALPEPLDPEFVERIRESLADPRPNIPAAEVRAYLAALHEERLKRSA